MPAAKRDIVIEQGVTFFESRVLKLADPDFLDDRTKDTLMPLAGYSGRSQVRSESDALFLSFTVTVDPVTSTVTRSATAAETAALNATEPLRHDLELYTAADADVIRLEEGNVTFSGGVTHA